MNKFLAISTVVVTLTTLPLIFLHFRKKKIARLKKQTKPTHRSNWEIIYVTPEREPCKWHLYKSNPCGEVCSYTYLRKIVDFIDDAQRSICFCVCIATCIDIQDALVRARDRGLNVRFITDAVMFDSEAARASFLKEAQLPIKVNPKKHCTLLHHKFCLRDKEDPSKARIFSGSLNLTTQGLTINWENIVFSDDSILIKSFGEEFEYLWSCFESVYH